MPAFDFSFSAAEARQRKGCRLNPHYGQMIEIELAKSKDIAGNVGKARKNADS
jgi:hypothetical protein